MRVVGGAILLATVGLLGTDALADRLPGAEWKAFIGGNEQFGRRLLHEVHSGVPEHNAVVSPLSISIVMAAVQTSADFEISKEIGTAFGWGTAGHLTVPARMLLAAFERADRIPNVKYLYPPEEAWVTNHVWYRNEPIPGATADPVRPGQPTLSDLFVRNSQKYFGIQFEGIGARPTEKEIRRSGQVPVPRLSERNDVLINSNVHLATGWAGNTFSMSKPFTGHFHTESGIDREVAMLKSEMSVYRHAKTPTFEAVALPCNLGYMVAVLPPPGGRIQALEEDLARSRELLDQALNQEIGSVTLPPFHTKVEKDLTPHLKQLGVRKVFEDLGSLFTIPHSYFSEVKQAVDIEVDQLGIRADAGTVVGAIYGGVMGGPVQPFSMELNRPFVYFVRFCRAGRPEFCRARRRPESSCDRRSA
jgi:serine protease inhibitor